MAPEKLLGKSDFKNPLLQPLARYWIKYTCLLSRTELPVRAFQTQVPFHMRLCFSFGHDVVSGPQVSNLIPCQRTGTELCAEMERFHVTKIRTPTVTLRVIT